ncbi:hypothetical protein EJ06DRAFT_530346 [Trichodelitschia bisporula]|uniref:Uncharacterized protein n=1 Tax=Trichodelitschia bisporula TaxID=703511 RepID=A0A6G1HWP9_9PEZI|nr:hypothetical protein EJ06DRAFT_530346 [Trichodelitschia bisporula]
MIPMQFGPAATTFPSSALPQHVARDVRGKPRGVRLEDCPLSEMTQYRCDIVGRETSSPSVRCEWFLRLFRRCADGLTVETTDWEWSRSK